MKRYIKPEALGNILVEHQKWLETAGKEGTKTDLSEAHLKGLNFYRANLRQSRIEDSELSEACLEDADLSGASLVRTMLTKAVMTNANLSGAILTGAELVEANLINAKLAGANLDTAKLNRAQMEGCDLSEATLEKANLSGAHLLNAEFKNADLQDAKLQESTGLRIGRFAGTNLSGAALPDYIDFKHGLDQVQKIAEKAGKLFTAMVLGCVYALLTIAATTDARLLTDSSSSPLPIIQTQVPISWFYWVGPLILSAIYLWFQLYLQEMWRTLAGLPAIFPDGKALDEKSFPWLLTGIVRPHSKLLRGTRPALSRVKIGISILLAWWAVPGTLFCFWLRYLPKHDWSGTFFHIGVITLSILVAKNLYSLATKTLSGVDVRPFVLSKAIKQPQYYVTDALIVLCGFMLYFISYEAIEAIPAHFYGFRPSISASSEVPSLRSGKYHTAIGIENPWQTAIPRLFELIGYETFANMVNAEVSLKPLTWKGEIELVQGARLYRANLNYALADGAFLVKADLGRAVLRRASLRKADLRDARLELSNISDANLVEANLEKSNLTMANLQNAMLANANLKDTSLVDTNLKDAVLWGANLTNADLRKADLEGVSFHDPWYYIATIATNNALQDVLRMFPLATGIGGPTTFRGANLKWARLKNARLEGVDLSRALELTQEQIDEACLDKNTKLPKKLELPKPCPEPMLEKMPH